MAKRYDQYCPVAHALDLVGERWALLVVRELMHGPKRYTDLAEHLPGIGTNILASRLRDLEACGVVAKRTLPPPAASRVYELTDVRPQACGRSCASWRSGAPARSGRRRPRTSSSPAGSRTRVDIVLAPVAPPGRFEFRVGDEVASLVDGEARSGAVESPDVVVEGDPEGIYHMFVDRRLDLVSVEGDRELLERLVEAAPQPVELQAPAA